MTPSYHVRAWRAAPPASGVASLKPAPRQTPFPVLTLPHFSPTWPWRSAALR